MSEIYNLYKAIKKGNAAIVQSDFRKKLLQKLEQADKFDLPEFDRENSNSYFWEKSFPQSRLDNLRSPFDLMAINYKTYLYDVDSEKASVVVLAEQKFSQALNEYFIEYMAFARSRVSPWSQYPFLGIVPNRNATGRFLFAEHFNQKAFKSEYTAVFVKPLLNVRKDMYDLMHKEFASEGHTIANLCIPKNGFSISFPFVDSETKRRASSGTKKKFLHRQLFFSPIPVKREKHEPIGTHASPAMHKRRGHFRQLKSGKVVWVKSSIVGKPENGVITKDYVVEGAS